MRRKSGDLRQGHHAPAVAGSAGPTAYVALAAGLTGILGMGSVFIDGMAVLRYVNALPAMFFYLLVGVRPYKLGRP